MMKKQNLTVQLDSVTPELEEQHQLSFWDALIVTTARKGGASQVLTEDLNPGQIISGVRIENHHFSSDGQSSMTWIPACSSGVAGTFTRKRWPSGVTSQSS
jgi:hypothetical protein